MDTTRQKHRLKVTAGPSYDAQTHQLVPVNRDETLRLENEHSRVNVCVRIQDYTGWFFYPIIRSSNPLRRIS